MAIDYNVKFPISLHAGKYIDDDFIDDGYFAEYAHSIANEDRKGYVLGQGVVGYVDAGERSASISPYGEGPPPTRMKTTIGKVGTSSRIGDVPTSSRTGEVPAEGR